MLSPSDLLAWLPLAVLWHLARLATPRCIRPASAALRRTGSSPPLTANEQAEVGRRVFHLLQHVLLSLAGGVLCYRAGWLTDPAWSALYAYPFPHPLRDDLGGLERAFYWLQMGANAESAFMLLRSVLQDGGRRQRMMLVHHVVTLLLVVSSWSIGLQEVGCVMFWLHDASDIGIDALKLALAWDTTQVSSIALLYALTLLLWVALRCAYLPLHVVGPAWHKLYHMCVVLDPFQQDELYGFEEGTYFAECWMVLSVNCGLSVLQLLHVIWTKEIIAKGIRELSRGNDSAGGTMEYAAGGGDGRKAKRG